MSFQKVQEALNDGVDPKLICATCPWDRFCIIPPAMTKAEVDKAISEVQEGASKTDKNAVPVGALLATLVFSGRDTNAKICPVLSNGLRLPEGKNIAEGLKQIMKSVNTSW